jgi:hypothetical protein
VHLPDDPQTQQPHGERAGLGGRHVPIVVNGAPDRN